MTKQRIDSHSTEFGLWTRQQSAISSDIGFVATNIDFVWKNYKTGKWMFIEEKRHSSDVKRWQHEIFSDLHHACKSAKGYCGFHLLVFENTNPDDGKMWLDRKEITIEQLVKFLRFEKLNGAVT